MLEFNAKGTFGLGVRNENSAKLKGLCKKYNMRITTIIIEQKE